jgi:hypothetical protein
MGRPTGQSLFLGLAVLIGLAVSAYVLFFNGPVAQPTPGISSISLDEIPFDGRAAHQWIEKLCQLGPRMSGSEGMRKQQELLQEHFRGLGGTVEMQEFAVRHPLDGSRVSMSNLVVRWHPRRTERILFCAHYDTRPYPDQDPDPTQRQGLFVGANDGASGVAVLAELGRYMPTFESQLGVDFALFDGEEFVFDNDDQYFLGSLYFAREYAGNKDRGHEYRAAVLLDMVADAELDLYQERNGLRWTDSTWIVESLWAKAAELKVAEFIPRPMRAEIRDDHLMLHDHGGIPACDIIDFSYGSRGGRNQYWHTRDDTPDKCSALSLAKVGWVLHEWLKVQGKK